MSFNTANIKLVLFATLWMITFSLSIIFAQTAFADDDGAKKSTTAQERRISPYRPGILPSSIKYYNSVWGVDNLLVRQTASGSLIRFSYRVTGPARAKVLSDDRVTPYLYGHRAHALLQIPVMEKVGPLRQSRQTEAGKEYWMTFSNKGHLVKVGDRVDVIIGSFYASGLIVE